MFGSKGSQMAPNRNSSLPTVRGSVRFDRLWWEQTKPTRWMPTAGVMYWVWKATIKFRCAFCNHQHRNYLQGVGDVPEKFRARCHNTGGLLMVRARPDQHTRAWVESEKSGFQKPDEVDVTSEL